MKRKSSLPRFVMVLWIVVLLAGCAAVENITGNSPEAVARKFVKGFTRGKVNDMLDAMCPFENTGFAFAVQVDWDDGVYRVLEQEPGNEAIDGYSMLARVLVQGRMRFSAEEIEKFLKGLGIPLPSFGMGTQIGVNFDEFYVIKTGGKWCVPRSVKDAFYDYLLEQILDNLSG